MVQVLTVAEQPAIGLEEFLASFEDAGVDTADPEALAEAAPLLAALARDRDFLAAMITRELEADLVFQRSANRYSPQVIMLRNAENHIIRANLWPAANDDCFRGNRAETFFYDVPHDHNFNLLTVGYFGPGYVSEEYDYANETVDGFPGETVELRYLERRQLREGDLTLYRASRDVHRQLPPDRLSVSLNIMDASPAVFFRDQYVFEGDLKTLRCVVGLRCSPALFALAAATGGEEARARLGHIFMRHDSSFVAMQALTALSDTAASPEAAIEILKRGFDAPSGAVREWSRRQVTRRSAPEHQ